jgi:hypothetical protein
MVCCYGNNLIRVSHPLAPQPRYDALFVVWVMPQARPNQTQDCMATLAAHNIQPAAAPQLWADSQPGRNTSATGPLPPPPGFQGTCGQQDAYVLQTSKKHASWVTKLVHLLLLCITTFSAMTADLGKDPQPTTCTEAATLGT